jgi:hypothetical protein
VLDQEPCGIEIVAETRKHRLSVAR